LNLTPRCLKRPEAENDLVDIWLYIALDNPSNADRFLDRIQESCLALANFPQMGTKRDELKTGLRSHTIGRYLIFYFHWLTALILFAFYIDREKSKAAYKRPPARRHII